MTEFQGMSKIQQNTASEKFSLDYERDQITGQTVQTLTHGH